MSKKFNLTIYFLIVLLTFSCSKEESPSENDQMKETDEKENGTDPDENTSDENSTTAKFSFGGEFIESQPNNKSSETSSNDLFAIQFFDVESKKPYAHVVGDSIPEIEVDFLKDRTYMMKLSLIKNGKNLVPNYNGHWSDPFGRSNLEPAPLNQVFYSSEVSVSRISSPWVNVKNSGGIHLEVDRYHGTIENFRVLEEHQNFTVELKRMVFGLQLNAELDQNKYESLYFAINPYFGFPREYEIAVVDGRANLEIPYIALGFPDHSDLNVYETEMDRATREENYQEKIHISIGAGHHHTLFFDDTITVSRNNMTLIDLQPTEGEPTSKGNLNITFEEDMMEKYIEITGNR